MNEIRGSGPVHRPPTTYLRLIRDKTRQCRRPHYFGSVNVEAFYRIAETFFGFKGLYVKDLFDVGSRNAVAGKDLVLSAGGVGHVVRFEDAETGSLADLAVGERYIGPH